MLINDLRREARFTYTWTAAAGGRPLAKGSGEARVAPGDKALVPISFPAPAVTTDQPGEVSLVATLDGKSDDTLRDRFEFTVLAPTPAAGPPARPEARVALYDPQGLTAKLLQEAGCAFERTPRLEAPAGCSLLIVGREAMTLDGPGLDLAALTARGTNVLIFEQSEEVLQRRWGFRTASPGVRRVYVRQPAHPVCRGLADDLLRDWRGSSSLVAPYPQTVAFRNHYPEQVWCGLLNTRTWKWGNYGTVATVVIEKPQRGSFSTILDCEFDQQYTPLLEWQGGAGRVLLSQVDFSGRDLPEPAATRLLGNLLDYAREKAPGTGGPCRYVGGPAVGDLLKSLGATFGGGDLVVIGPGAEPTEARAAIAAARTVLCLGLDGPQLSAVLPFEVKTEERRLTHTLIGRPTSGALAGLGNSEFHWRARLPVAALTQAPAQLQLAPNGILGEGTIDNKRYVLMQSLPTMFDWREAPQLKRTWRHSLTALSRVLTNCGAALTSPLPERLNTTPPVALDLAGAWRFTSDPPGKLAAEQVAAPEFDAAAWRELKTPGLWESQGEDLKAYDGFAWYRKEFTLETVPTAPGLVLKLGAVDDEDWTYLNGRLVGHIGRDTHPDDYWSADRVYAVPPGLLRVGRNVIAVRVNDLRGGGGIARGPLGLYEPGRWLSSYYLDDPVALDDPYRYNRW